MSVLNEELTLYTAYLYNYYVAFNYTTLFQVSQECIQIIKNIENKGYSNHLVNSIKFHLIDSKKWSGVKNLKLKKLSSFLDESVNYIEVLLAGFVDMILLELMYFCNLVKNITSNESIQNIYEYTDSYNRINTTSYTPWYLFNNYLTYIVSQITSLEQFNKVRIFNCKSMNENFVTVYNHIMATFNNVTQVEYSIAGSMYIPEMSFIVNQPDILGLDKNTILQYYHSVVDVYKNLALGYATENLKDIVNFFYSDKYSAFDMMVFVAQNIDELCDIKKRMFNPEINSLFSYLTRVKEGEKKADEDSEDDEKKSDEESEDDDVIILGLSKAEYEDSIRRYGPPFVVRR